MTKYIKFSFGIRLIVHTTTESSPLPVLAEGWAKVRGAVNHIMGRTRLSDRLYKAMFVV